MFKKIIQSYIAFALAMYVLVGVTPTYATNGERGDLFNTHTVGTDIAPIVVTIPGMAGQQVHLYRVIANCRVGFATLTIHDGTTKVYDSIVTVQRPRREFNWDVPFTTSLGNSMTVTLNACSVVPAIGATGEMSIEADRHLPHGN
jgi:hypothetical protein